MQVGVLGGGVIGAGWARLLEAHGHTVRIYDPMADRCRDARSLAEAVTGADLIVEAAPEDETLKRALLAEAGEVAPPGALLASSSSSILPSRLQEGVQGPERVLVLHPLHPVELMPVVEVVPGRRTGPEAVVRARTLLATLGKIPVVLHREVTGYVVNRLVAALWREAADLVLRGVVDPADLDEAASQGPCLGWAVQGPLLTEHLAAPGGLGQFMAHLHPAFAAIWRDLARWEALAPGDQARLAGLVERAYPGGERQALEAARDRGLGAVLAALTRQ